MKRSIIKIIVIAAVFLSAASVVFASAAGIGTVASSEGKVDLLKSGQTEAAPVSDGTSIGAGDIIRTKSQSKAEINFGDGTILKIADSSRVQIKDFEIENGKRIKARISLERGSIRAIVSKSPEKNNFSIETPNASGSVKGTDLFVSYLKSSTSVLVINGKFSLTCLSTPEKAVEVTSGNSSFVAADQPPEKPRAYLALEKNRYESATTIAAQKTQLAAKPQTEKPETAEGYTQPSEIRAVVVNCSGKVAVRNRSSISSHDAKLNEMLSAGDAIETKEDGKIQIKLDNGNVIDLKPNSHLLLQKLTQDLKTGDYENLLESNIGKIRAKVIKMKGKSRFEIKTPTAVAMVRGTIMYLDVQTNSTTSYFEEGNGFVTNTISGNSQVVPDGTTSTSDNQGNVSNPTPESESGSSGWHEGWDSGGSSDGGSGGNGGEGYSAPEGETTSDTGDTGGNNSNTDNTTNTNFNGVPVTETDSSTLGTTTTGGSTTTETTTTEDNSKFTGTIASGSGNFGYYDALQWDETSDVSGTFKGTESLWTDSPLATFSGSFSNPNNYKLWGTDFSGTTKVDNEKIIGSFGGIKVDDTLEGYLCAFYIKPDGSGGYKVGYLTSDLINGTFDPETGKFNATANLTATEKGQTSLTPADFPNLDGNGTFGFESNSAFHSDDIGGDIGGNISGTLSGESISLEEPAGSQYKQNWGLWRTGLGGTFGTKPSEGLDNTFMGGEDNNGGSASYWIGQLTSPKGEENWLGNKFRAIAQGAMLSDGSLGEFRGNVLGTYDDSSEVGTWQALGIGYYTETPLAWSSRIDAAYNYGNYDGDDYVYLDHYDYHYGIIGATESPFTSITLGTPVDITLMGKTYPDYYISWWGKLKQNRGDDGSQIPYGFIAGATDASINSVEGRLVALYVDSSGNAGTLSGDFGDRKTYDGYYSDIKMWKATGTMTATQRADGDGIVKWSTGSNYIDGNLYGNFNVTEGSGGEIYNYYSIHEGSHVYEPEAYGYLGTYTAWLVKNGNPEPWGIYNIELSGNYSDSTSDDWALTLGGTSWRGSSNTEYWLATVTGDKWSGQRITGTLAGKYLTEIALGNITGYVLGSYDTNDSSYVWEAIALGTFTENRLTLSGYWGNTSLYYNNGGSVEWAGEDSGLIGSITPKWWNETSFPIVAMGEYYNYYKSEPCVWNTPIYSYNAEQNDYTTLDGGAFNGYTAGIWKNGTMTGSVAAIYMDPNGNAGVLRGDISGDYYPDLPSLAMWKAEGTLKPTQLAQDIGITPDQLGSYITSKELYADVSGNFGDGTGDIKGWAAYNSDGGYYYGDTYFIDVDGNSQNWGTYSLKLGDGNYYSTPVNSKLWTATIGGTGNFGYNDSQGIMKGKTYGVYNDINETWVATSVGVWNAKVDYETADNSGGSYYGFTNGVWDDGIIEGAMAAIYIQDPYFDGDWSAITETGQFSGSESGVGMGSFGSDGTIEALNVTGTTMNVIGENWGIWKMDLGGTYAAETSPSSNPSFRLAAGGTHSGGFSGSGESYWLGTLSGDWGSRILKGEFKGAYFDPQFDAESGNLTAFNVGSMKGDFAGVHEVTEVDTTWKATGVGEWVELAQLDPGILGFTNTALADMVSVPVTETYSSLLTGSGALASGGTINVTQMDISFYAKAATDLSGIWTALLNGNYTNPGGGATIGSVALSDSAGTTAANLTNLQWNTNNTWVANVTDGKAPGGTTFSGQAGGTYTGTESGTLTGVGAGTWTGTK